MLELTKKGLLPAGCHPCTYPEFADCFVRPFPQSNRLRLFDAWLAYNDRLKQFVGHALLTQWIDGSFVTNKKEPADIDLVTFVPYQRYEPIVEQLIDHYSTFSLYSNGLDAYICPVYPSDHEQYELHVRQRNYWQKTFGTQRDNLTEKGFLQIEI